MTLRTLARASLVTGALCALLAWRTGAPWPVVVGALWMGSCLGCAAAAWWDVASEDYRELCRVRDDMVEKHRQAREQEALEQLWREPWDNRR